MISSLVVLNLVDQILAVLVRLRRKNFVFYAAKPYQSEIYA
jgi:hypothetical protein